VTSEHAHPAPSRSFAVSWAGLALGPASWALDTIINYALVSPACGHRINPVPMIAAVLALASLAGALSSWRAWRGHEPRGGLVPEEDGHPRALLSGIGVASGFLFAIVIVMQGLAALLLEPCVR
jgi:hypothetical protein